jgi:alpha-aminoadipate carrier protein LysW
MLRPLEVSMPVCPECESALDFEADEVEEGDVVVCDECGTEFEVVTTDPLEITKVEEGYEDEDEELVDEEEE